MNLKAHLFKPFLPVLAVLHGVLTVTPIVLTYWLYRLAERAALLIGRWPVPMINDPKWIGPNDRQYQHLFDAAERADGFSFSSFFIWIMLMVLLVRWYSVKTRWWQFGLFAVGWGTLWFNPWQLLYWWED